MSPLRSDRRGTCNADEPRKNGWRRSLGLGALAVLATGLTACGTSTAGNEIGTTVEPLPDRMIDHSALPEHDGRLCEPFRDEVRRGRPDSDGHLQWSSPPSLRLNRDLLVRMHVATPRGKITIELDPRRSPIAVNNLVFLTCAGFFDDTRIHRVQHLFVVQFGDPTMTMEGGPGYRIPDEPVRGEYTRGTVAMARDPGTDGAGSQWFIKLDDRPLAPVYQIVGRVVAGMEVADELSLFIPTMSPAERPVMPNVDLPVSAVRVTVASEDRDGTSQLAPRETP